MWDQDHEHDGQSSQTSDYHSPSDNILTSNLNQSRVCSNVFQHTKSLGTEYGHAEGDTRIHHGNGVKTNDNTDNVYGGRHHLYEQASNSSV